MKFNFQVLIICLALAGSAFAGADGAAIFKARCAMCHGPNGDASSGMAKAMGLKPLNSPDVQKQSAADLTNIVANGKGKMPAFKPKQMLTDEEISAVVSFVKSLK